MSALPLLSPYYNSNSPKNIFFSFYTLGETRNLLSNGNVIPPSTVHFRPRNFTRHPILGFDLPYYANIKDGFHSGTTREAQMDGRRPPAALA